MRCSHCNFDNVVGVINCQVCGERLELKSVVCHRCNFNNSAGQRFCGQCGALLDPDGVGQPVTSSLPLPEPAPVSKPIPGAPKETSPVVLIGFGAVVALASVAYPWFIFGSSPANSPETITLSTNLSQRPQWFPGAPLIAIALSVVCSTFTNIIERWSKVRPYVSILSGLLILFSAAWLWQGYQPATSRVTKTPIPGEMSAALVVIGGIIITVGGLWALHRRQQGPLRSRRRRG